MSLCGFLLERGGGGVAYIFRKASASQGVFQRSDAAHIAGYRRDEEAKSGCRLVWELEGTVFQEGFKPDFVEVYYFIFRNDNYGDAE